MHQFFAHHRCPLVGFKMFDKTSFNLPKNNLALHLYKTKQQEICLNSSVDWGACILGSSTRLVALQAFSMVPIEKNFFTTLHNPFIPRDLQLGTEKITCFTSSLVTGLQILPAIQYSV